MNQMLDALNRYFFSIPDHLRRHKAPYWIGILLAFALAVAGAPRLKMEMTQESFFTEGDESIKVYDQFKETFGSDEGIILLVEAKDGDIFSPASMEALKSLTLELQKRSEDLEGPFSKITRVTSLYNANYLEVSGDSLVGREFVADLYPLDELTTAKLRRQAMDHPDFPGKYVTPDFRYATVMIETSLGTEPEEVAPTSGEGFDLNLEESQIGPQRKFKSISMEDYANFWHPFQKALEDPRFAALSIHAIGTPPLMAFFMDNLMPELNLILMGAMVLVAVVLFWLFRSVSAVVWPMAIVLMTMGMTFGIAGWLGLVQSMMMQVILLLILVVGVADAVHIQSGYLYYRREGEDHEFALRHAYRKSGLACLLTSVTTGMGMLSLVVVPVEPVRIFGVTAFISVALAFLLTIYLLPLGLELWRPFRNPGVHKDNLSNRTQRVLRRVIPFVERRPGLTAGVFAAIFCYMLLGLLLVKVDSNIIEIIRPSYPIQQSFKLMEKTMGQSMTMEVVLDFGQSDALKDPAVQQAMDRFAQESEKRWEEVTGSFSIVDVVKQSYRVLNQNDPAFYKVPETQEMLAQTLILVESSSASDRKAMTTEDYSQARISFWLHNRGSSEYKQFYEEVQVWMEESFGPLKEKYPNLRVELTGGLTLMMNMSDQMSWSQIKSFSTALLSIMILLLFVFGSFRAGLVAMLPNVFPIAVTFGVMGYLGISLDVDTLVVAPVIIGIAVDDTIHFLTHYKEEYKRTGDIKEALEVSMQEVGQALVFTSLILGAGFLMMLFAGHLGIANFGILSVVAVGSALIADLVLLPALCIVFDLRLDRGGMLDQL